MFAGNAAYNVSGTTLHSMLQIPINYEVANPAPRLTGEQEARLQETFKGTRIMFIGKDLHTYIFA